MSTEQRPPRALRRDARENLDRILSAAPAVLAERGPNASMEAIAERAGVGIGTLYRRFPTREALLTAVAEREVEQLEQLARSAVTSEPWAGLTSFLEHAIGSPVTDPGLRQVLVEASPEGLARDRWQNTLMPAYRELVAHARESGVARDDLASTDLSLIVMAVASVARQTGGTGSPGARRILAIVLAGLQPSAAGALPVDAIAEGRLAEMLLAAASDAQAGSPKH